ncbi:MAG: DUF6677 family protein [Bryobacteraceae bacterium]
MKLGLLAVFGWLVPGGAYLLTRRYLQFAGFAVLVSGTFALGLALHGGYRWPQPAELQGLDSFTILLFKADACTSPRTAKGGSTQVTHLMYTLLVAVLLASATALIGSRPQRERLYAATYLFLCCAVTTLVGSWVMYLIHG